MSDHRECEKEFALQKADEIHRILLDKSPDPIFAFSREGRYLYVNLAFAEGVGKTVDQIIDKMIGDVFGPEEAAQRVAALQTVFQSGEEKVIEVRVPRPDNDRYYITTITPLMDSQGTVNTVICSSKDITERKRVEQALQESETKHRLLLDHSYDLIWNLNAEGVFTYVSSSWKRITGYIPAELVNTPFQPLVHPDDLNVCMAYLQKSIQFKEATGTPEYRVRHADGTWHWHTASATPVLGPEDEFVSLVGVSRDISERKQAEAYREESSRQLKMVIELLPDATFVIDHQGKVIFWNKAIEVMTGIPKEQMIGQGNYAYAIPFYGERRPILIDLALLSGSDYEKIKNDYDFIRMEEDTLFGEVDVHQINDGKGAYLLGSASKLRDASGNTIGAIESIRDITERKLLEKELGESEEKYRLLVTKMEQGLAAHEVLCNEAGKVVDYRFIDVNASFEKMTGLKREEIIGKTVLEILPETESYWIERYGHVAMTGETLQYQNYSQELGRYYEIVAYSPRHAQFAVIVSDITDRKQMERLILNM